MTLQSLPVRASLGSMLGTGCAGHSTWKAVLGLLLSQSKEQGSDNTPLARLSVLSWGERVLLTGPFPELGRKTKTGTGRAVSWQSLAAWYSEFQKLKAKILLTHQCLHTHINHSFTHSFIHLPEYIELLSGDHEEHDGEEDEPGFALAAHSAWWEGRVLTPQFQGRLTSTRTQRSANREACCRCSQSGDRPGRGSLSRAT